MRKPASDATALVIAVTVVTAVLVLAVVVVNREGSADLAVDARDSILAEGTLSAASAQRHATNQAILVASTGDQSEIESAIGELEASHAELHRRFDALTGAADDADLGAARRADDEQNEATDGVIDALRAEDLEAAAAAAAAQGAAYEEFVGHVAAYRDARTEDILLAAEGVGRVSDAVRYLVVFVIPLGLVFRFRRGQRRAEERRSVEEELAKQREIAKSKDEFIADLSHELRTPLTGIYGFALALEEAGRAETGHSNELLNLIISEADELSRMVDDLIAAGRLNAGELTYAIEHVDLGDEMARVVEAFSRRGAEVGVEPTSVVVRADPLRLRQLIRNLVSNAVRHGGAGILIRVVDYTDTVGVEVIDDGPGVPEDVEERLFSRYVHTGGSALLEGSVGLGLSIARSLAEGMDGSLMYLRRDGRTVFRVVLRSVMPTSGREVPRDPQPSAVSPEPNVEVS